MEASRQLVYRVNAVVSGDESIGSFVAWFRSIDWENAVPEDAPYLDAVLDIENIVHQIGDYPESFDRMKAKQLLRELSLQLLEPRASHDDTANT